VTDASSAHLRFQGPEPAVTVLPAIQYRQTRPCLIYDRRARPLHVTPVTFSAVKPVPICTAWWTEAHVREQLAQGHYLAVSWCEVENATSGLQIRRTTVTPPN